MKENVVIFSPFKETCYSELLNDSLILPFTLVSSVQNQCVLRLAVQRYGLVLFLTEKTDIF